MRTANPALNEQTFTAQVGTAPGVMTLEGTASKTLLLLGIVVLVAGLLWTRLLGAIEAAGAQVIEQEGYMRALSGVPGTVWSWMLLGAISGLIVALVTIFKPVWSPVTAPIYAACEGGFLAAFSAVFEYMYPGIVLQAVTLTFGIMAVLLLAYRARLVRATENFKLGVIAATGGIFLVYLVTIVLGLFGVSMPFIHQTGLLGIGFSVFVVIIAALNLVLDFDFIETGVARGAPKYMEWYAAFGLLVTLVWLYIEIVRLLAKLRSRD